MLAASADVNRGTQLQKTVGHAFAQASAAAGNENPFLAQQVRLKHESLLVGVDRVRTIVIQWERIPRSVGGSWLFFLAQLAANVRPEFFDHVSEGVVTNLRSPNAGRVGQSAIGAGVVAVGRNSGGRRAATNLGKIELLMPRIGAGDKNAADGVTGAMQECAIALLKETRVLVKHGRENCSSQK